MGERNRSEQLISTSQIAQAEAQIRLVDEQLARSRLTAPFAGIVISGDNSMPGPTTSDTRGTYTPPSKLDGRHTIHLIVSLPNPGNIGLADFT